MKTKRMLTIAAVIGFAALGSFAIFRETRSARAAEVSLSNPTVFALPAPTPTYTIKPSETDGPTNNGSNPCPGTGIGCDGPRQWGKYAPNDPHALSVPASKNTGKLLVFFTGAGGEPAGGLYDRFYHVATLQGYHVIGITYFTKNDDDRGFNLMCRDNMSCYGKSMREVIDGTNCDTDDCSELNIDEHTQDSIVSRLFNVLRWARANYPDDGWERYLTPAGPTEVINWEEIHLAGFSNGSGYAALMGMLFPSVKRVSLFAGPNDGNGDSEEDWVCADWIERIEGITDTHYYGLVHELNRAEANGDTTLYKVTRAWKTFGMGTPYNPARKHFDPKPGTTYDFMGSHMLISTDKGTIAEKAHASVIRNEYVKCEGAPGCIEGNSIGYAPAWRCVLGTGDASISSKPVADAGPNRIVECLGSGGATVELDGTGSKDDDCDVLSYAWAGPFGLSVGRKPSVFLPMGTNDVTLSVRDPWRWSLSDATQITVVDTTPPALRVFLTPTVLSPANNQLVRINATVNVTDRCGEGPPEIVLTSITSNQRVDVSDIQGADFGTFDQNFFLRAERNGRGRIYTITYRATDARGNQTLTSATVQVLP